MKKVHFWSCLLLIIVMTACSNKDENEMGTRTPSGQFFFDGQTYNLHYCSILPNELFFQIYEA